MRKALSVLLLSAVPALALSACNTSTSGTGISALPNHSMAAPTKVGTRMHPHDFSAADLHAGGATFPAYAYNLGNQPVGLAETAGSPPKPNPQAPPGAGSLFDAAPTTGTIYYCLTGSGFGRKAFENQVIGETTAACAPLGAAATGFGGRQDPPDFVGTDQAMPSTEYTNYYAPNRKATWGEPVELPVIGGPIVYGFRPKDFPATNGQINLSLWSVCAIANGTISNWNDAALTADNGGKALVSASQPITFYFRSDSSGTTYNFESWLIANCTATWPAPYNAAPYEGSGHSAAWVGGGTASTSWTGPGSATIPNSNFVGENGNPGVLAGVQGSVYGTGYLEGAWAASANPKVGQASVLTGFKKKHGKTVAIYTNPASKNAVTRTFAQISSSAIVYGGGSDGLPVATSRPECMLYIPTSALAVNKIGAYPILAVSYLLFYGNNNSIHTGDKEALIDFLMGAKNGSGGQSALTIEAGLEYSALSPSVRTAVETAVHNGTTGGTNPCMH